MARWLLISAVMAVAVCCKYKIYSKAEKHGAT